MPPDAPNTTAFIEAACNSGDGATIVKMHYFEDMPDDVADFALAFAEPWGFISTIDLADHKKDSMIFNGRSYVPNLTDLQRVKFKGEPSRGAFSIGKTPYGYYAISGVKRAE